MRTPIGKSSKQKKPSRETLYRHRSTQRFVVNTSQQGCMESVHTQY